MDNVSFLLTCLNKYEIPDCLGRNDLYEKSIIVTLANIDTNFKLWAFDSDSVR